MLGQRWPNMLAQHCPNNRNIGTDRQEIIIGYITLAYHWANIMLPTLSMLGQRWPNMLAQHCPNNRNIGTDGQEIFIGYLTLALHWANIMLPTPTFIQLYGHLPTLAQRMCAVWDLQRPMHFHRQRERLLLWHPVLSHL